MWTSFFERIYICNDKIIPCSGKKDNFEKLPSQKYIVPLRVVWEVFEGDPFLNLSPIPNHVYFCDFISFVCLLISFE